MELSFVRAMRWEGEFKNQGVGQVIFCDINEKGESENGSYAILCGYCSWSILSGLRMDSNPNNIEKLSKKLNLSIEAYSDENDFLFEEHFLVENGEVKCDERVDFDEFKVEWIDKFSEETLERFKSKYGVTKEKMTEQAVDGFVRLGGYPSWDFSI